MKIRNVLFIALICAVLVFLYLASSTDLIFKENKSPVYNVTVYMDKTESYDENFVLGATRAADDVNANIKFVTLTGANAGLLDISEDTRGIVVAVETPGIIDALKEQIPPKATVAVCGTAGFFCSGVTDTVTVDYSDMGRALARSISADDSYEEVVIVTSGVARRCDVQIQQAAQEEIDNIRYVQIAGADGIVSLAQELKGKNAAVLCTDTQLLENLAQESQISAALYGVGWSSAVKKALENGRIKLTAVEDRYVIGYLAVSAVVDKLSGAKVGYDGQSVRYELVKCENMYSNGIEIMLFPSEE